MSAQACLTAWNEPMALPNWWRTFAYPTVAESMASLQTEAVAGDRRCRTVV